MNRFVVLTLMVIVPVFGVLLTMRPDQPDREGTMESSMSILDAVAILHNEVRKREHLDETFARVRDRIALKREIAYRVIEETMTLDEAASRFRAIIAECNYADIVYNSNEGESEAERICRDVVGWVAGELMDDPPRQKTEVERLEAEVAAKFGN